MQERKPKYGVYVIFQGALAFHDEPGSSVIDVYMPEVTPHVYKAGSFCAEKVILGPRELLAVTGVPSAAASRINSMRGHENAISVASSIVPGADYRAKIRMPRPSKIFYCKKVWVNVAIGVQPAKLIRWAQVPVFAYDSEGDGLALTGRACHWTPGPESCKVPDPKPITLSILATGEEPGADLGPALAGEMFGERVHIWDPATHSHDPQEDPDDEIEDLKAVGRLYEVNALLSRRMMFLRNVSARFRAGNFDGLQQEVSTLMTPADKTSCGPVSGGGGGG